MELYSIFKKPVITEKSAVLSDSSKYTFIVAPTTNKIEVKKAFKLIYGVDPLEVKIVNTSEKRSSRRGLKKRSFKKAIVSLKKGENIDLSKVK